MKKEEVQNNGHLLPVIGALIGGAIGTLPWILCYVYANMMYSILTVFVAFGAFKGYEIMKGKMDKSVPIIIAVISFIAISIATLVVIPNLLLIKEAGKTSIELYKTLFAFGEFKSAIIQDYLFSLLFTGLGISGIIANIRKGVKNGDTKIDLMAPAYSPSEEEINKVKAIFEKKNAFDKTSVISKDSVMNEIKENENVFNFLRSRGIIKAKNGGFYYDLELEKNPGKRTVKIVVLSLVITFAFIFLAILIGILAS